MWHLNKSFIVNKLVHFNEQTYSHEVSYFVFEETRIFYNTIKFYFLTHYYRYFHPLCAIYILENIRALPFNTIVFLPLLQSGNQLSLSPSGSQQLALQIRFCIHVTSNFVMVFTLLSAYALIDFFIPFHFNQHFHAIFLICFICFYKLVCM